MRFNRPADPTEQEIAEACAGIQAGWTDQDRRRRLLNCPGRCQAEPEAMTVQEIDTIAFGTITAAEW